MNIIARYSNRIICLKDDKCFCGNVTEQGPSYGCITPCPGRGDEICGGPIEMSVYSTKGK